MIRQGMTLTAATARMQHWAREVVPATLAEAATLRCPSMRRRLQLEEAKEASKRTATQAAAREAGFTVLHQAGLGVGRRAPLARAAAVQMAAAGAG